MPKTKVYLLGPVSPWNSIRKENFIIAADKLRKLGFEVSCCFDFLMSDVKSDKKMLFLNRMSKMMEADHVVLLIDWAADDQAMCLYNVANNADMKIDSFTRFQAAYLKAEVA